MHSETDSRADDPILLLRPLPGHAGTGPVRAEILGIDPGVRGSLPSGLREGGHVLISNIDSPPPKPGTEEFVMMHGDDVLEILPR